MGKSVMDKQLDFILEDKLPTYYDATIAIFSVSTERKRPRTKTITSIGHIL